MSVTAKSVVFDIADNHGDASHIGIRSIEFKLSGSTLALTTSDFSASSTSSEMGHDPDNAFDTTFSKTGGSASAAFKSSSDTDERLIVVFNEDQTFDEIVINNGHDSGSDTDTGANNVKITESSDEIMDTTYDAAVSNSTVLSNSAWPEHVGSDAADDNTVWPSAGPPAGSRSSSGYGV